MGRKRVVRIPKSASLKCPHCLKISRVKVPNDSSLFNFKCKKCKNDVETPESNCCIICAFSDKKCGAALRVEAGINGLTIKSE